MLKADLKIGHLLEESLGISNNLIYESVYSEILNESYIPLNYFQKFVNIIKTNNNFAQVYSKQEILNLFPARWKAKKYLKNSKIKGKLIIFKINFNDKNEIIKSLKFLQEYSQSTLSKENFNKLVYEICYSLTKENKQACFMQLKGITKYAIMFVQLNFTVNIFRHEFIHYYQWVTDREIQDILVDFNTLDNIPLNLENLSGIKNIDLNIEQYVQEREIIPYINELVDQVNLFSKESNIFNKQLFVFNLAKNRNEINDEYIDRIITTDFYQWLIKNNQNLLPLTIFVICQCFNINENTWEKYLINN